MGGPVSRTSIREGEGIRSGCQLERVKVQGDTAKGQAITVLEWMKNGSIRKFVYCHHVNTLELVCCPPYPSLLEMKVLLKLYGVAQGLEHAIDDFNVASFTHGSLKRACVSSILDRSSI
jgi:hypothetical protein